MFVLFSKEMLNSDQWIRRSHYWVFCPKSRRPKANAMRSNSHGHWLLRVFSYLSFNIKDDIKCGWMFLVACTRLYNPLRRSVGPSVRRSVGPSVRWSVGPSFRRTVIMFDFPLFYDFRASLHCSCPIARDSSAVYPTLFSQESLKKISNYLRHRNFSFFTVLIIKIGFILYF